LVCVTYAAGRPDRIGGVGATLSHRHSDVFGMKSGAFGEYVSVAEDRALTLKPTNLTFEQAAAVPIAANTALQALRDKGRIHTGQKVLINGASGGIGTFAVQILRSRGDRCLQYARFSAGSLDRS
jgi:NADPH:quinone reductase-like Zn-dependent oxidoreductase